MSDSRKKQLHIKLPQEVYDRLKDKCDAESRHVQDFLADIITQNVTNLSSPEGAKAEEKDEKLTISSVISECPVFNDIVSPELEELTNSATYHRYEKGRIVVWEEEICDSFRIVADGSLKIYKTSSSGKEFIIEIIGRGESFGELTIISGNSSPYFIGAQALEGTSVISIPKETLQAFFFRNPQATTTLFNIVMTKMNALVEKLTSMGTEKAEQRVVKTLVELLGKYGNRLSLNHREIAGMSATTQETVSRVLNALQNRGAVRLSRGEMIIVNKAKLLP